MSVLSSPIVATPQPPYYAVIFTSRRTAGDHGYGKTADHMVELAAQQPGFLGIESVRDPATGVGITVSYWRDEQSILQWKAVTEHRAAQEAGKNRWYEQYEVRVARVERAYGHTAATQK